MTDASIQSTSVVQNDFLSRAIQKKILAVLGCQFVCDEGRRLAFKSLHEILERILTELIMHLQNSSHISSVLWTAVRARGCQFLGPGKKRDSFRMILM